MLWYQELNLHIYEWRQVTVTSLHLQRIHKKVDSIKEYWNMKIFAFCKFLFKSSCVCQCVCVCARNTTSSWRFNFSSCNSNRERGINYLNFTGQLTTNQLHMLFWRPLLGLLQWYPVIKPNHSNSPEDGVPNHEFMGALIKMWGSDLTTAKYQDSSPKMAFSNIPISFNIKTILSGRKDNNKIGTSAKCTIKHHIVMNENLTLFEETVLIL